MKIYLYTHPKEKEQNAEFLRKIIVASDVTAITPTHNVDKRVVHKPVGWEVQRKMFEEINGFIIETTTPTNDVTYLLAQALIAKTPALCLYEKSKMPREFISALSAKKLPAYIQFKAYTHSTAGSVLANFLQTLRLEDEEDFANIKFTLRFNARLAQYIDWKAAEFKQSKADFLRDMVQEHMESDPEFLYWLSNQKERK